MKKPKILPTANPDWGFWGTSVVSRYNAEVCWQAASEFLIEEFGATPEHTREILDSRYGRHLADTLESCDTDTADAIKAHLKGIAAKHEWNHDLFVQFVSGSLGKTRRKPVAQNIDDLLTEIAKTQLGLETLATRNSDGLDFHEVAVWQLKAALIEAYNAGTMAK